MISVLSNSDFPDRIMTHSDSYTSVPALSPWSHSVYPHVSKEGLTLWSEMVYLGPTKSWDAVVCLSDLAILRDSEKILREAGLYPGESSVHMDFKDIGLCVY